MAPLLREQLFCLVSGVIATDQHERELAVSSPQSPVSSLQSAVLSRYASLRLKLKIAPAAVLSPEFRVLSPEC